MPINFFSEDTSFVRTNQAATITWVEQVIVKEKRVLGNLNFVYCSDAHLLEMNISYLNHDTYTDIITFDNSESVEQISGDIFISVDRVEENAVKLTTTFEQELDRVMIHGVLHLIGYNDKTVEEKSQMREKEDAWLSLR